MLRLRSVHQHVLHFSQVEARLKLDQREPGGGGPALSLQEDVYGPFSGQAGRQSCLDADAAQRST